MKKLPWIIRWFLVTLMILLIVATGAYAYVALTGTFTATIEEPLRWVGPSTYDATFYPQESRIATFTVANASTIDLEIDILHSVTPPSTDIAVTVPNKLTVPGAGQAIFEITITASKSAAPSFYTIEVSVDR